MSSAGLAQKAQGKKKKLTLSRTEVNILELENEFPVKVFPQPIQDFILQQEYEKDFIIGFLAAGILSATSVAVGNSVRVMSPTGAYDQPPIMFIGIVGDQGVSKTWTTREAHKPIVKRDIKLRDKYAQEIKEYKEAIEDAGTDDEALEEISKPERVQTLLQDATMEAIIRVHAQNPRGIVISREELLGLIYGFNKHNAGKGDDQEKFTEMYDGGLISKVTKGFQADGGYNEDYVKNSNVNIIGAIQPSRLTDFFGGGREHSGFATRFLLVKKPKGWSLPDMECKSVNIEPSLKYETAINNLFKIDMPDLDSASSDIDALLGTRQGPIITRFSSDGAAKLIDFINGYLRESFRAETDGALRGLLKKMENHAIRLCFLIHALDKGCEGGDINKTIAEDISLDTVERGIELSKFFHISWVQCFMEMKDPFVEMDTKSIDFYEALPDEFTTKQYQEAAFEIFGIKTRAANERLKKGYTKDLLFTKVQKGVYKKRLK